MINLPTFYLNCHNLLRSFDPLLAISILIFMNVSQKESLVS